MFRTDDKTQDTQKHTPQNMSSLLDSLLLKVGTISRNSARIAEASASERKRVAHPCARPLCKHPPSNQQPQDDGSIVCELCGAVVGVEYKQLANEKQLNAAEDPTTRADAPRASSSFEAQTSAQGETSEESRKRRLSETGATWSGRHANAQRIVAAEAARDAHNAHEGKAEQKNRGVQKALRKLMTADNVIPEESASVFRKNAYHALHANLQHRRVCQGCPRVDLMAVPSSLLAYLTIQVSVQNYLPDEAKNSLRISQLVAHTQTIIPHQSNVDEVKTELTRSLQEHHGSVSCVPCSVPVVPAAHQQEFDVESVLQQIYKARSTGLVNNSTRDNAILMVSAGLPSSFLDAVKGIETFAVALLLCLACGGTGGALDNQISKHVDARRVEYIISTIGVDSPAEHVDDI